VFFQGKGRIAGVQIDAGAPLPPRAGALPRGPLAEGAGGLGHRSCRVMLRRAFEAGGDTGGAAPAAHEAALGSEGLANGAAVDVDVGGATTSTE